MPDVLNPNPIELCEIFNSKRAWSFRAPSAGVSYSWALQLVAATAALATLAARRVYLFIIYIYTYRRACALGSTRSPKGGNLKLMVYSRARAWSYIRTKRDRERERENLTQD
ncbi:unnamed protein product [Trichogramma brassicae]|uniref:Uncharacterized protein n=1 Tax=Trichogramma brassicae TaxID=86971 RepID=A0A6H5J180_9HYME|nr:unnamed protein product [Trichogramma brassicae]